MNNDISWGNFNKELVNSAEKIGVPLIGTFELTPRCNLRCGFCYIARKKDDHSAILQELSAREWLRIAGEAREAGMLYLLLTGGEVFIRKDFREIYSELARMGFVIQILTNATLITPEIIRWLSDIPPAKIGVTIYGASENTYAKVCKRKEGFVECLRGVDLLTEASIKVDLRTTIVKDNIADFRKIAELAEERQLHLGVVNYVYPPRNNPCHAEKRIEAGKLVEYECMIIEFNRDKHETEDKNSISEKTKKDHHRPNDIQVDAFNCSAAKCSFWIRWDGLMIPCATMVEPAHKVINKPFKIAWEKLKSDCKKIPICQECLSCIYKKYCNVCPARLKNETGYFDRSAPYLCQTAKKRYEITQAEKYKQIET